MGMARTERLARRKASPLKMTTSAVACPLHRLVSHRWATMINMAYISAIHQHAINTTLEQFWPDRLNTVPLDYWNGPGPSGHPQPDWPVIGAHGGTLFHSCMCML